jgi:hypothetical protein
MDIEVMLAIDAAALFSSDSRLERLEAPALSKMTCKRLPVPSSYIDFIASFILSIPHVQKKPWNTNILSFLNHIIDALLLGDGLSSDEKRREALMRQFCHQVYEMQHWMYKSFCFSELASPRGDSAETAETFEFNVLLTNVVLCRRTTLYGLQLASLMHRKSTLLGTLLGASVKSGQVDLIDCLLDTDGVDINHEDHSVLKMAAECANDGVLRTIFTPKYGLAYLKSKQRIASCKL